jgi:exodeoxyribonuclease VII large subunit
MEDLWAFNDERVARAIHESELPVISAVGHEPDVTIADYVADARASTPSNAAEIAVPDQEELRRWLLGAEERLVQSEQQRLERLRQKLDTLAGKRVMTDQLAYVQDKRMELVHVQQRLGDLAGVFLGQKKQQFAALAASLDAMSPLKVLGRGYAMVQNENGQILKSYRDVESGERVNVTLGEGGFSCTVEEPLKEERR